VIGAQFMEIYNIESFLSYFHSVRQRTMRVVAALPAEKLEWRHSEGVFSSGDLARHIAATERYTFAENVLGRPSRYQGCGPELADGHDSIATFMERMHQETTAILEALTPTDLERKIASPSGRADHCMETAPRHDRTRSASSQRDVRLSGTARRAASAPIRSYLGRVGAA
jgi:uncharacterized damage-inducible protein DinB